MTANAWNPNRAETGRYASLTIFCRAEPRRAFLGCGVLLRVPDRRGGLRRRWSGTHRGGGSGGLATLEVGLPLTLGGEAVHLRPVRERALGGRDIVGLAGPRLLRRRLQSAAVR